MENSNDKDMLDSIILKHKGQPVGWGYIDIIVHRNVYREFVLDLLNNRFPVSAVSWWEYCQNPHKAVYGLGGPKSKFYDGWFSELPEVDDIPLIKEMDGIGIEVLANTIFHLVESKEFIYPDRHVSFLRDAWLTPAFWLDVPDSWRNTDVD